jgi:serine/threonine protein kinase
MVEGILELDRLCIHCLCHKGKASLCPQCGYDERQYQEHPLYLKPRTVLKNQYVLGIPLGQGGFGITYLGLDKWLQKKVAIKEYLPAALVTRDVRTAMAIPLKNQQDTFNQGLQLFITEARNLAKFDHSNIVRVLNFFEENQTAYMVMEYLEGRSLTDLLNQVGGRLSVASTLAIVLPLLNALAEIHAHHIYHRDISPQNIRLLNTGIPILLDFGAARYIVGEQSRSLDLVLKHGYSPLEQYSGKGKIGAWTDIYAVGAVLYLMLTGILPPAATDRFGEDNLTPPIAMNLEIPLAISNAVMRALAIKSEERFQTVAEFQAALQGQTISPVALSTLLLQPLPPPSRRQAILIRIAILGLLVGMMIGTPLSEQEERPLALQTLFNQAQIQWAKSQLVTPLGDNVYDTYQQILAKVPNHAEAQQGLRQLAEYYQQLAQMARQQGHFADALTQAQQGLKILPKHPPLQALEQQLIKQVAHQEQLIQTRLTQIEQLLQQASRQLTLSQWNEAVQTYQRVLTLAPQHQLAQQGIQQVADNYWRTAQTQRANLLQALSMVQKGLALAPKHSELLNLQQELLREQQVQQQQQATELVKQKQIKNLLEQATAHLTALRLTDAYDYYQQILALTPDHAMAKAGLQKIADHYEQLAHIEQNDWHKNLELIDKGLKIIPTHSGLLALRQHFLARQAANAKQLAQHTIRPPKYTTNPPTKPSPAIIPIIKMPVVKKEVVTPPVKEVVTPLPTVTPPLAKNVIKPMADLTPSLNKFAQNPLPTFSENAKLSQENSLPPKNVTLPSVSGNPITSSNNENIPLQLTDSTQNLLTIAQQHVETGQLEAAYQIYRNLLTLAPDNSQAINGLHLLANRYEQLAQVKQRAGRLRESLLLIQQGLLADATHAGLLTLQAEIIHQLDETVTPKTPNSQPSSIFTPSF